VRFENKKNSFIMKNGPAYYNAGVVIVNFGANPTTFELTTTAPALY
jgi:hypothetical protein